MCAFCEDGTAAFTAASSTTPCPPLLPGLDDTCERLTIADMRCSASGAASRSSMPESAACSMMLAVLARSLAESG